MEYKIIFVIIAIPFLIYCWYRWVKWHRKVKLKSEVEEVKDAVSYFEERYKK